MVSRNATIDFSKGICVIAMIFHHCINYFYPGYILIKYVRFVTGAFIFITGFLISYILSEKYSSHHKLGKRLFFRGFRLLFIFSIINITVSIFLKKYSFMSIFNYNQFFSKLYTIFISGSYHEVDFALLIPISYVLIIIGTELFFLNSRRPIIFFTIFIFTYTSIYFFLPVNGYNIRLVSIGLCGYVIGMSPPNALAATNNITIKYFLPVVVLYFAVTPILTFYHPIYFLIVLINLYIIYYISKALFSFKQHLTHFIHKLGVYSLFSYFTQIFILQFLKTTFINSHSSSLSLFLSLLLTFVGTYLAVVILIFSRKRFKFINSAYRFIF